MNDIVTVVIYIEVRLWHNVVKFSQTSLSENTFLQEFSWNNSEVKMAVYMQHSDFGSAMF